MKLKRLFDILLSIIGLISLFWLIFLCWLIASIETCSNGLFFQNRVGLNGKIFRIIKIKTMINSGCNKNTITIISDVRITKSGSFFRKTKLDELPQFWNILKGDMSFVGPRPDVPGYADNLLNTQKIKLLSVRPGLTGPASLVYRDEEFLLSKQTDPVYYNDYVIYPDKVKINLLYIDNMSFKEDMNIIFKTLFGVK